ncbi:hypothetical protein EJB05_22495, partial [Eragrostis curvula]
MAAADPQAFFLTPPPRHLAELRIDTAPSAVAFSAPCAAAGAGRNKRRCLVPASSVRKRMLLELAPFDVAPASAPASTPPPPPSRTPSPSPSPSPVASRAGSTRSPAGEFSFDTAPRVALPAPASPGNIFAFLENAAWTPGGSEPRSALPFLAPQGQTAKPAVGFFSFLAAAERPKTPTSTGPTANGGFVFAAPPEGPLTPTSTNTSGGLSFLASPKQPLTPMGSTATGGFVASSEPFLMPAGKGAVAPLISLKPARTGSNDAGDNFAFPSPSAAAKESMPAAVGLATPPSVPRASRSSPPLRKSGDGSRKRLSLFLRRAATLAARRRSQRQQQFTPPPQKIAKTNASAAGEASRSSVMSGSRASPCCTFFTSPSKDAAKQEAKKVCSEASRSPAGSRCSSPARPATPEKVNKPEREEEVYSSPRERAPDSPVVLCSGAEVVVRVTCKCGVHKEFCFDHRL